MFSFKTKWLDLLLGAVSLVLLAIVFIVSANFPKPHIAQLGAAVFPRIIAVVFAVVGIYISFRSIGDHAQPKIEIKNVGKVVISFLVLLLYGLLLKRVGFLILTPVFIAALLYLTKFSNILIDILTSVLTTAGIYLIFKILLSVPLPEGLLGF